jgi:2-haloacid dehalogenase
VACRPEVIAFDVVETLFSLTAVERRFVEIGLDAEAVPLFFSRMLRDAFALASTNMYVPFRDLAKATLEVTISSFDQPVQNDKVETVLQAFSELEAHPDVAQAVERASSSGVRLFALTNGSAATTQKLIGNAGLTAFFEKTLSIDDARHWKPHRDVYQYAVRAAGVAAERVALIAAHSWDTHGAKQAGLITGWVQRREKAYSAAMSPPDVQGATLTEVVDQLLRK